MEDLPQNNYQFHISESVMEKMEKGMNDLVFRNRELLLPHNPFDQERREISAIRNGNLQDLIMSWQETYSAQIGTLADNALRQAKNHAIVLVTLASRAAMEGGLQPEISYSLSDIYMQQIEKASTPEASFLLGRQAEYHYTRLVADSRTVVRESPIKSARMETLKKYIFIHLHEKIHLAELADQVHVNRTYLCEWFQKENGITLGEYIARQKVHAICNMLIYSDATFSAIASYFSYSSQSHMTRQFRQVMGCTPLEYRRTYQRIE